MHDRWHELTNYLTSGELEIDNNGAENQIRPFALGRKNWLLSGSPRGAHASALFYSLLATAIANEKLGMLIKFGLSIYPKKNSSFLVEVLPYTSLHLPFVLMFLAISFHHDSQWQSQCLRLSIVHFQTQKWAFR